MRAHAVIRSPLPLFHDLRLPGRAVACALSVLAAFALAVPGTADAVGARLYKSGPIQITADGSAVWVVNPDNDSVSRITTATDAVLEIPLPAEAGVRHVPSGLSVRDDGAEVWVACRDSDRIYVLSAATGAVLQRIDLPWGTGPYSVVLSPPVGGVQSRALVAGHRGERIVVLDVAGRSIVRSLEPVFHSPAGIAFTSDGAAWVTHLFADGEHPRLTRVDWSAAVPRVTTMQRVGATHPQNSANTSPQPAEGGYQTLRGHPAQVPAGADGGRLWLPVQNQNLHDTAPSPDSTVQSVVRKVNLASRTIAGGTNHPSNPEYPAKIIVSAVGVHDPTRSSNNPLLDGPGWDAGVSGPVDLAFSADGATAWMLHEQSEDVLVMPTSVPPIRPAAAPSLVEIGVGKRPMGIVGSPVANVGYVANILSRDVSVLDLTAGSELRRIAVTPVTGEPLPPGLLRGAQIFHSSNEDALSLNRKVACASCHVNAEADGRDWDNQHLPGVHGPRATQTILGLASSFGPVDPATGWGQLHRSGDRDEVQDFEHTQRGPQMGGLGFFASPPHPELGTPNAGRSLDSDRLAAYVLSLPPPVRSPARAVDGSLSAAARRGATFFRGNDAAHPADAGCAACHDPSTGFSDRKFHDVGQGVRPGEVELPNRNPPNHVNTPSLLGSFATPPYGGIVGFAEDLLGALIDFRDRPGARAPHGDLDGLTDRQMRDLQALVRSLDGSTTAAEVLTAVDDQPPQVVRVAPTSATRVEVWFDESVDPASAANPAAYQVTDVATGQPVAVLAASHDGQNGDRVTLTTAALSAGCAAGRQYTLAVAGPVLDLADSASGGVANALTAGPAVLFHVVSPLTITLGASGYENLTVEVHDAATIPGLTTWSHGSSWLLPGSLGQPNTGFVRFEWSAPFSAATGVSDPADLASAEVLLSPELGDSQSVEALRVLQPWFDHRGTDFNNNPVDPATGNRGPTWRDSQHNLASWNTANARATQAGVEGDDPADYHGPWDTARTPDAVAAMPAINEPLVLAAPRMTEAFRFWMTHPTLDHGYALRLASSSVLDAKFHGSEPHLREHGPVLRLSYLLPVCGGTIFADGFESGNLAAWSSSVP